MYLIRSTFSIIPSIVFPARSRSPCGAAGGRAAATKRSHRLLQLSCSVNRANLRSQHFSSIKGLHITRPGIVFWEASAMHETLERPTEAATRLGLDEPVPGIKRCAKRALF